MHQKLSALLVQRPAAGLRCCLSRHSMLLSQKSAGPAGAGPSLVIVDVDSKTGVAVVTFNSPPVNKLNARLLNKLEKTIKDLENNKATGLILTSFSDKVFSAGLDFNEMYNVPRPVISNLWSSLQRAWLALYRISIPTVAAISGHAPAGGCIFSLACNYRVMVGPHFKIGLNETQFGLMPPKWGLLSMRDAIGLRKTEMALVSGRMFTASEALDNGLIESMVSNKDEALAEAQNFISKLATVPAIGRRLTKELTRQETIKYMEEKMPEEVDFYTDLISSPDVQKCMELYLQTIKNKNKL